MDNIRKFLYENKDFLELTLDTASYLILKDWISLIANQLNIERKEQNQLMIVVDEIFSNIVKYAYSDSNGTARISVTFYLNEKILELKFIDKGVAYNPLETKIPNINAPIQEREIGGLGVFIVKNIMDDIVYKRYNGSNILILKKLLKTV